MGQKRSYNDGNAGAAKLAKSAAAADTSSAKSAGKAGDAGGDPPRGRDADGAIYWELSKMRRVGVSHFRNLTLINIREYYETAGQMRPGKKGISLSLEQFRMLVRAIPHIQAELQKDGVAVDDLPGLEAEGATAGPATKGKLRRNKANIEATSDEDSS